MKYYFFFFFFVLFVSKSKAQNCNCAENFIFLKQGIKNNYAGYDDKLIENKKILYTNYLDNLSKEANATHDDYKCYLLLKKLTAFFNDSHLNVGINMTPNNADKIREMFFRTKKIKIDEAKLEKYYANPKLDKIEGIWEFKQGTYYKVAIIKKTNTKNEYLGVILKSDSISWVPGQLKIIIKKLNANSYSALYYKKDHSPVNCDIGIQNNNVLKVGNIGYLLKVTPLPENIDQNDLNKISLKEISQQTVLLKIPSFGLKSKKELDSIVSANWVKITSTRNLIIDLRDNSGGYSVSYDTLLPLIYTNPIKIEGYQIVASKDNIELHKTLLTNKGLSEGYKEEIKLLIKNLESAKQKFYRTTDGRTFKYDSIYENPQKIALIVNKGTASASELFFYLSKQSKKVISFGENTLGEFDYLDVIGSRNMPCPLFNYNCPVGKSDRTDRVKIDNVGFKPDIFISKSNKDWILDIKNYLEK